MLKHSDLPQTIRSFQALSVSDATEPAPQDQYGMGTFPTYTDAVDNSICEGDTYM